MSAEIATLDKVRAAVAQIRAAGSVATADRVIAHLGGGSKATVLRHLKMLRDSETSEDSVPPAIVDMAKSALADIYKAGVKAGEDRSAAGLMRLTASIGEVEAQIEELATENGMLRDELESLRTEHETTLEKVATLEAALDQSATELRTARNELVLERGASAEKLASLMTRLEEGVASMTRNRGTLRLPKDRNGSG